MISSLHNQIKGEEVQPHSCQHQSQKNGDKAHKITQDIA